MLKYTVWESGVEILRPICEEWSKECNADGFGLSKDVNTLLADLQTLVNSTTCDLIVIEKDDKPIGFVGIVLFKSPIGDDLIANEHFWFVVPKHRGSEARRTIEVLKKWAKVYGCSHLILNASNLASEMHDRVCGFYERVGMKKFETSYICEV